MDPQQAKFLTDQMTGLWEGEFKATCAVLSSVPDDKRDYTPDAKGRSAWQLAVHIATADIWFIDSILSGAFTWDPDRVQKREAMFSTIADVVAFYEKEFPARIAALRAASPEQMARTVDFFGMMQRPAASFLGLANNHSVHHRGQLSTYLRSMGAKVPPMYGDSADFPMKG
ncbi:MAG: DinB family protein [Acidobacteria bacterium]|jgi:uncharacterized damage-inducible protein DinB|nr:DinB family protein [Acidobacteriota bacterium]